MCPTHNWNCGWIVLVCSVTTLRQSEGPESGVWQVMGVAHQPVVSFSPWGCRGHPADIYRLLVFLFFKDRILSFTVVIILVLWQTPADRVGDLVRVCSLSTQELVSNQASINQKHQLNEPADEFHHVFKWKLWASCAQKQSVWPSVCCSSQHGWLHHRCSSQLQPGAAPRRYCCDCHLLHHCHCCWDLGKTQKYSYSSWNINNNNIINMNNNISVACQSGLAEISSRSVSH